MKFDRTLLSELFELFVTFHYQDNFDHFEWKYLEEIKKLREKSCFLFWHLIYSLDDWRYAHVLRAIWYLYPVKAFSLLWYNRCDLSQKLPFDDVSSDNFSFPAGLKNADGAFTPNFVEDWFWHFSEQKQLMV